MFGTMEIETAALPPQVALPCASPEDLKDLATRFWEIIWEEKLQNHFSGSLDALTTEFLLTLEQLDFNHSRK
jgi:hypothetical protein